MNREFAITAPDARLLILVPAIGLVVGFVGIAIAAREEPRVWWAIAPTFALIGLLMLIVIRRRRIAIEGDRLRIAAALHTATVPVDQLDLAAARIVNLSDTKDLRPFWKTFGIGMPGFRAGHFRLRNRKRAFVLLTANTPVLVLPEHSGRLLLLSLERPQALLDALRDVASRSQRR